VAKNFAKNHKLPKPETTMKKFLFSTTFSVATLLAATLSASACPPRGCVRHYYIQPAPYVPQTSNGISANPVSNNANPGNNAASPGTSVKPAAGSGQGVEWDLPAEEKARIREAVKSSIVIPKPEVIRISGQGGRRQ
jgi:hypothetical protein